MDSGMVRDLRIMLMIDFNEEVENLVIYVNTGGLDEDTFIKKIIEFNETEREAE